VFVKIINEDFDLFDAQVGIDTMIRLRLSLATAC